MYKTVNLSAKFPFNATKKFGLFQKISKHLNNFEHNIDVYFTNHSYR